MKRLMTFAVALFALASLACESALPHQDTRVISPWESFEGAKAAFDQIEPGSTTARELVPLGYDPFGGENVAVLTYMDIFERFVPNASMELDQQDEAIQDCVRAQNRCLGYRRIAMEEQDREFGNFWLNLFEFKTETEVAGFEFESTLVLVDDVVVYKLWEGHPAVLKRQTRTKPLGFLNDFDIKVGLTFP
jgi:hypothetical protein